MTEPVEPPNQAPIVDAGSFTVATDGTEVGAVTATDPEGTAVTYAITDGNDADGNGVDAFVIDTETGALTVNDPAELVAGETITLTIEATDEAGQVGTGTVTVAVTEPVEPPNEAPVVDAGSFTVATDGTEVGAVTATDPEGTAVTYAITDGNDADGNGVDAFVIDTETGALTVNDPAELVAGETITLTIEATDEAGQVGTGTVTVAVTEPVEPPNEAPIVDAGSFTVATDGTEVGAVTATDPEGTAVTYAITDGNDADGNGIDAFVIDTETGALTVNDPAELVAGETITLTIEATDEAGQVGTGTVTVAVTEPVEPPNEAPVVDAGSFTVATDGTEVGAVTATDPEGTAVTYAITDGNDADGNGVDAFVIDTETGALTVNDPAELVAGETITLTIEATDEAGQVGTGTVTVAVTEPVEPPNEAPVVDAGSFTVATDGTEVGAVTATDPEGTAVTYAITDGNDADGNGVDAFVIDTETGALTVNDPAELVAGETITLTVEATDADGIVGTGTVTVEVTEPVEPPNQAPVVDAGSFTVATDGIEVGAITATDPEGTAVTYAITDGNDADGNGIDAFVIDTETGALTVNDPAELVAGETITLTVEATDADGIVGTGTVTVEVTEPVEPPNQAPVVDAGSFTVATDGIEVGAITATDPEGTAVTYAITDGNDADGNGIDAFVIDTETGALTVNDPAELVAGETITLTIEATDEAGQVGTGTVTVAVTEPVEPPNQAPVVDAGSFTVATDGTEVGAVTATDPEGTAVTYAITDGNDADGNGIDAFVIDTETGALTVNDPAELVAGETITLTVEATDADGIVGTGTVTVEVTEPVEPPNQAPVITSAAAVNAAENQTAVTAIIATDADTDDTLTYTLSGGADMALFAIDTTGALTFVTAPDFETPASAAGDNNYLVTVAVSDSVNAAVTQEVTVKVTDVNDTLPASPTTPPAVPADTAANENIDGTQGSVFSDAVALTTVGMDRFIIEFNSNSMVVENANISITGFDANDRLFFDDAAETTLTSVTALDALSLYNFGDNGTDLTISAGIGDVQQSITLVGITATGATGVGTSIDSFAELNTFMGQTVVEVG
ncbi:cadherin repeat domain-containing protein [Chromatium okenii]|uniref:cadherin repeat domain-containing protein n=1 Tax=Chromatium okenii TaxID=61644 RepID=UPI001559CDAE|nr:cadherin repeat domain-containing protein [Chromatium okenii]